MGFPLKYNTASQEILLGPFLDDDDGLTEKTGLTIANTDIKLFKAGATTLANKNSGGATEIANGYYYAVLDATDTNTIGALTIVCRPSDCLPVKIECIVYPAEVFDYLFAAAGTDYMKVDVAQWNGSNVASPASAGYPAVTLKVGTGTGEVNLSSGKAPATVAAGDLANGSITAAVIATDAIDADAIATDAFGALELAAGAATEIATAVWASGTRTLTALDEDSTTIDLDGAIAAAVPSAAAIADAVWDEASTGHTDAGKAGAQLWTDIDSLVTQIGTAGAGLTAVPWNAAWDAEVQSEVDDSLNTAFTDATSLNAGSIKDRLRVLGWIIRNKVEVTDANGNTVVYKDDNATQAYSVATALTDDSTTTTRKRME